MRGRFGCEVMRMRRAFADIHEIPSEKPERKSGESGTGVPLGGASASVRRSRARLPCRLAWRRRETSACVGRHHIAAPPVRPRGRADPFAADVRVVHQWTIHERRHGEDDVTGGQARVSGRRILGRVRRGCRRRLQGAAVPDDDRMSIGAGEADHVDEWPAD